MSTSILTVETRSGALTARLGDYLELTKPRIVVMELIVAGAAACLAAPHAIEFATLLHALFGTALVAASASIANQWLERRSDALMPRTAARPLATGRVGSGEALALAGVSLAVGTGWLVWHMNWLTAALGVSCWLLYVAIYTPLKSRTPLNTAVGAVAGAMPVLMGWTATGEPITLTAACLAAVLFLWQFPHFMAIAWLYREDYASGNQRMLTVVDPSGFRAGRQAVVGALALLPVSMVPALVPTSGSPLFYVAWVLLLGSWQLALAVRFAAQRDDRSARRLLRGTLVYLPVWLALLLIVNV